MGGAYVAKPDAAVTPPDVPDGWDEDWDFPGPNPPGYTPDYSLSITAGANVVYNSSISVDVKLYDHETYETVEPSGSDITWTAAIGGVSVNLRLSGESSYSSSITSSYSELETDIWGAAPTFEFELDTDDVGETLVLTASSTVNEGDITDTAEITILLINVYTARIDLSVTCSENPLLIDSAIGRIYYDYDGSGPDLGFTWSGELEDWVTDDNGSAFFELTILTANTGYIDIDSGDWGDLLNQTLTLRAYVRGEEGQYTTISATFKLYINEELSETHSQELTATRSGGFGIEAERLDWITINSTSITVL